MTKRDLKSLVAVTMASFILLLSLPGKADESTAPMADTSSVVETESSETEEEVQPAATVVPSLDEEAEESTDSDSSSWEE